MKFYDEQKQQQANNISIDFDGVIHDDNKGWHDGTVYGRIIPGSKESIKELAKDYTIIIFSAKARPDRPLVDGKTGVELIREWLAGHDLMQYVSDITHEKPRALCYIDDKAVRFTAWPSAMKAVAMRAKNHAKKVV